MPYSISFANSARLKIGNGKEPMIGPIVDIDSVIRGEGVEGWGSGKL